MSPDTITPSSQSASQSGSQTPSSTTNWSVVLAVATGIIVVVTLVAIFFVIPKYAEGMLGSRINSSIGKLNINNSGIAVGEPNPSGYDCTADRYNCANFTTQAQAQVAFDACFDTKGDVYGLDGDGNGKVCEGLE